MAENLQEDRRHKNNLKPCRLTEEGDFKIGGRVINKVRFADDTAIIAKTEELQDMVNRLVDRGRSMAWKSTLTNHK